MTAEANKLVSSQVLLCLASFSAMVELISYSSACTIARRNGIVSFASAVDGGFDIADIGRIGRNHSCAVTGHEVVFALMILSKSAHDEGEGEGEFLEHKFFVKVILPC